jgi:hypothetical protein
MVEVYLRRKCYNSFCRLLRHPWKKERGAIILFCLGHHETDRDTAIGLPPVTYAVFLITKQF